jgi:hypothetical protein
MITTFSRGFLLFLLRQSDTEAFVKVVGETSEEDLVTFECLCTTHSFSDD